MAAALTIASKSAQGRTVSVLGTIALSGNYATGGDALPLSAFGAGTTKAPHIVKIHGKAGFVYEYDAANGKLLVREGAVGPLTELAAGAYPAGATGDSIRVEATFPKFG